MNRVCLIGRLTGSVELRYTPNGVAVANFTIAVDRIFSDGTDFIPIQVWKKDAENCANYLDKGKMCSVDGKLRIDSFDGQDGQRRWKTYVVSDPGGVRFLSPKDGTGSTLGNDISFSDDNPFA